MVRFQEPPELGGPSIAPYSPPVATPLAKGHLPRVPRQSRVTDDKGNNEMIPGARFIAKFYELDYIKFMTDILMSGVARQP